MRFGSVAPRPHAYRILDRSGAHMNKLFVLAFSLMEVLGALLPLRADSVARPDVQLHFTIEGNSGPYVMVLSGGPGEEVASMEGIAEHLRGKYRCIMLEQRGTGRSKLSRVDASTINLRAYIDDIEAVRKHLNAGKIV